MSSAGRAGGPRRRTPFSASAGRVLSSVGVRVRVGRGGAGGALEGQQVAFADVDGDVAALLERAEQQLVDQLAFDLLVDEAAHRAGAVELVVALAGDPLAGGLGERE